MLSPRLFLEAVVERPSSTRDRLRVYWVCVESNRERFVREVMSLAEDVPLAAIVVRDGFANPNALLEDVVAAFECGKTSILEACGIADEAGCEPVVALVARTELDVPQVCSPIRLPDWFLRYAGRTVEVEIEDITWCAAAALNDPVAELPDLCRLLFELDGELLRRLRTTHAESHNNTMTLFERLRQVDSRAGKPEDILCKAEAARRSVSAAVAFRPSARDGSVVGLLSVVAANTAAEKLGALCDSLATAINLFGVTESDWQESLMAVVARPVTLDTRPDRRFARNLILSVNTSCQFVTAAAHADQYAKYPHQLIRGFTLDLRRSLDASIGLLQRLPPENG